MKELLDRLYLLSKRHERFIFDLRGNCLVYTGVVAAYKNDLPSAAQGDLACAVAHAWEHDSIVVACKDGNGGAVHFASCRLFTDQASAERFAQHNEQPTVYNLNRGLEVQVDSSSACVRALAKGPDTLVWTKQAESRVRPGS